MKKLYAALSAVLVQIIVIAVLMVVPQLPSSKAVTWSKIAGGGIDISAVDSRGGKNITEQINTVVDNYCSTFNPLYDKNVIHYDYYEVLSNSRHISVLKIESVFQYKPSAGNENYRQAGSKTVEIWFNIDNGELKTQIKEISNTMNEDIKM